MHLSNFCGEKHLDFKTFKRSALLIRQIEYLFHWLLNCKCILDIFMDESQTMERSYLWCSFSHFIYILESFEQCRLNTFLCYAMLLATAFTNFHHAITTRFKCTSCAVDLSNERQQASEATPSSVDFLFLPHSSTPFIAFHWRKILYVSKKWAKLTFVNWMLQCTESHSWLTNFGFLFKLGYELFTIIWHAIITSCLLQL